MNIEKAYPIDVGPNESVSKHDVISQHYIVSRLTEIWQDLLHIEPIAPDQNYFALSGDTSDAIQMFSLQLFKHIEQEFKIELPLTTLVDAPTIRELAEVLWVLSQPVSQPRGTTPHFVSRALQRCRTLLGGLR